MKFINSSNILCIGPSGSGKSSLIAQILANVDNYFTEPFHKIIYCYDIYQKLYDQFKDKVVFHQGVFDKFEKTNQHTLIIYDDLFDPSNKTNIQLFTNLAIKIGHHMLYTNLICMHNIFFKEARTISLNAHYIILLKQVRDLKQIATLASQIAYKKSRFFMSAYEMAMKTPYSHFICQLRPEINDNLRFCSEIFSPNVCYFIENNINTERGLEIINYGETAATAASIKNSKTKTTAPHHQKLTTGSDKDNLRDLSQLNRKKFKIKQKRFKETKKV